MVRAGYDEVMSGSKNRYDLGSGDAQKGEKENITQIMWPSDLHPSFAPEKSKLHQRGLQLAKALLGDDMAFDFDMLINKLTDTVTPFHQDASYWPDTPDTRALSFWVALEPDMIDEDRGCMWYGPGTHEQPLRKHETSGPASASFRCEGTEEECVPEPLGPGDVAVHGGRTLHYSRGNKSGKPRRAYIMNFRP